MIEANIADVTAELGAGVLSGVEDDTNAKVDQMGEGQYICQDGSRLELPTGVNLDPP